MQEHLTQGNLATTPKDDFGYAAFISALTHDDRKSFYRFCTKSKKGEWKEVFSYTAPDLMRADFSTFDMVNCYLTINGFTRAKTRATAACRQVNAIALDIDCHESGVDVIGSIDEAYKRITQAIVAAKIPEPTLVVHTGRGLQIYYMLEKSVPYRLKGGVVYERAIKLRQMVYDALAKRLTSLLVGLDGVSVDTKTSDIARVMRIPGTVNQANGRRARLIYDSGGVYYSLNDLKNFIDEAKTSEKTRFYNFEAVSISRRKKLRLLQTNRNNDCEGSRNEMCFIYYNSAVQVYTDRDDAFEDLVDFNSRFRKPLSLSELKTIRRSVDNAVQLFGPRRGTKGCYTLSSKNIIRHLSLTPEEIQATGFFENKRANERAAAKAATRERRLARDHQVASMALEGLTQAQIAQEMGLCRQTVAKILRHTKAQRLRDAARTALDKAAEVGKRNDVKKFGARADVGIDPIASEGQSRPEEFDSSPVFSVVNPPGGEDEEARIKRILLETWPGVEISFA